MNIGLCNCCRSVFIDPNLSEKNVLGTFFVFISFQRPWSFDCGPRRLHFWPSVLTEATHSALTIIDVPIFSLFSHEQTFFWNDQHFQSKTFLFPLPRKKVATPKHRRLLLFWRSGFLLLRMFCFLLLHPRTWQKGRWMKTVNVDNHSSFKQTEKQKKTFRRTFKPNGYS